jgi:hypothetical protein
MRASSVIMGTLQSTECPLDRQTGWWNVNNNASSFVALVKLYSNLKQSHLLASLKHSIIKILPTNETEKFMFSEEGNQNTIHMISITIPKQ